MLDRKRVVVFRCSPVLRHKMSFRCICPFLLIETLAFPHSYRGLAFPQVPYSDFSTEPAYWSCSHFSMFRPADFMAAQITPTASP